MREKRQAPDEGQEGAFGSAQGRPFDCAQDGPSDAAQSAPAGFEADLRRLEEIVQRLEGGELALDESLRLYEEAVAAYRRCQAALREAELRVRKLVETVGGELREEPFEPPSGAEGEA